MYCTNCGKQIDENADICLGCGKILNKAPKTENKVAGNEKSGKSIASMVLGIIAIYFCLSAFAAFGDLEMTLYGYNEAERVGFAIGFVLIQTVCSVIAFVLSLIDRKTHKNGFNTAGFWLAIASFVCIVIQFIAVFGV